jgi:hypothetical protein
MDRIHRLNEAEIADALSGQVAEERISSCETCAAEFEQWKRIGEALRDDVAGRADLPSYFWTRQRAYIRERLSRRAPSLRWATALIFALLLIAFVLIRHSATPNAETTATAPRTTPIQVAKRDPDDVLLRDIEASVYRELPTPLAPGTVLVEELASASNQAQGLEEN